MAATDKYILIDFDDCQMETELKCRASLAYRVNELYGPLLPEPFTPEIDHACFTGLARQSYCQAISLKYNIPVDYEAVYDRREERLQDSLKTMEGGITMAPNLIETLEELQQQDYKFALVSNSPIPRIKVLMEQANNGRGKELLALFGENFFSSTETAHPKPAPDVYQHAMQTLGVSPGQCIAIEDSKSGATAALAAGITTFGFTGFSKNPAEEKTKLVALGCRDPFDDWKHLPRILAGQQRPSGLA